MWKDNKIIFSLHSTWLKLYNGKIKSFKIVLGGGSRRLASDSRQLSHSDVYYQNTFTMRIACAVCMEHLDNYYDYIYALSYNYWV